MDKVDDSSLVSPIPAPSSPDPSSSRLGSVPQESNCMNNQGGERITDTREGLGEEDHAAKLRCPYNPSSGILHAYCPVSPGGVPQRPYCPYAVTKHSYSTGIRNSSTPPYYSTDRPYNPELCPRFPEQRETLSLDDGFAQTPVLEGRSNLKRSFFFVFNISLYHNLFYSLQKF